MRILLASALVSAAGLASCSSVPIPPPPSGVGNGGSSGDFSVDVVRYTNDARLLNGLPPLTSNPRLMEAARIHAEQMASFRSMDHTIAGARYPTMQSRLDAVGYAYSNAAENIAWNMPNPERAVNGWMSSAPHRTNILDAKLTEMGAAIARDTRGESYWIQVFGRPR